jgi:hypothetical protein
VGLNVGSGKKLKLVGDVIDTNGNEWLKLTATASAVNELTLANAATGGAPILSATGGDTNIGIALTPKGTGGVVFPAGAVGTPAITTSGDTNTGIFFPAADTIAFVEGGAEAMRIDSSGNVGIGTSSPTTRLSVAGGRTTLAANGETFALGLQYSSSTGPYYIGATNSATPDLVFSQVGGSERMRVTNAGDVGIGTSSPAYKLEANGTVASKVATTADASLAVQNSFASFFVLQQSDKVNLYTGAGQPIVFTNNNTERARITAAGDLLVGIIAPLANGDLGIQLGRSNNARLLGADGTGSFNQLHFVNANGIVGTINTSGSATSYLVVSDYRLKTVIGPVADAGQRIDALQPVEYTWNADGSRTRGFLAHQFQEVYAGSVTGAKDAVDAEGKPVYQQMQASTSEVIADLVAEIQSLRARVAALESN